VEGILPQINSINDSILGLNEIKNTITERVETNLSISTDNSAIAEEIYASSENMNAFSENIAQSAKSLSDMTKELMNQFHEFESV
jgi:methyl-accepting chemotaxis protein